MNRMQMEQDKDDLGDEIRMADEFYKRTRVVVAISFIATILYAGYYVLTH